MVQSIRFLEAGHTEQLEKFVNPLASGFRKIRFPATVAVIEHATAGIILFDTGYSPRFHEKTRYFPEKVYALLTPVTIEPENTAFEKLKRIGIRPDDITHVILSHFHADHIAGAADFTKAKYIYSRHELNYFKSLNRILQVKNGFIAGLLPEDLETRALPADEFLIPLSDLGSGWFGKDLFGDESVFAVPLPGHTLGQIGLYVRDVSGKSYFLVADAAWISESFEQNVAPMRIAQEVFFNRQEYRVTLDRIHNLFCRHQHSDRFQIVACHCDQAFHRLGMTHV
jgi:glyoxylase-like metal-dependent hydrolase (beta-lactamase superfamily II)